jgi:mannose-6-phosphate isomerase-like protein (cupin superfamily)
MFISKRADAPQNHRGGQISYLLLEKGQFGASKLAITMVEGGPGSKQEVHSHTESEQVYVIVRGRGLMHVGEEAQELGEGDLVYIPPSTGHFIENVGEDALVYVSATSPPFDAQRLAPSFRYR